MSLSRLLTWGNPLFIVFYLSDEDFVDLCYRPQPFPSETKRIEYLYELYDKYTAGLFKEAKNSKKKKDDN
jgi:hypothetical protein